MDDTEKEFIRRFLRQADSFYNEYGDEWLNTLLQWHKKLPGLTEDEEIAQGIEFSKTKSNQSSDVARFLIRGYCDKLASGYEHVNPVLSEWILEALKKIANGEDANKAFGIGQLQGRKTGSTALNYIKISCYFELLRRQGETYEKAQLICESKFHTSTRNIAKIVKEMNIPRVCEKILYEFSHNDYSYIWNP